MEMSLKKRMRKLHVSGLAGIINFYLSFPPKEADQGYDRINNGLYRSCKAHLEKHSRKLTDNILVLVHHDFVYYDPTKKFPQNLLDYYQRNIEELIMIAKEKDWSISLFTFPELYKNHKRGIETKLYTKAFFTEFGKGTPYKEDLQELEGKSLIFAGCYGDLCIRSLIEIIPRASITVVPQAILLSPRIYNRDLGGVGDFWDHFPADARISLRQLKPFK